MMKRFVQLLAAGFAFTGTACVSVLPEAAPAKPRYHIAAADIQTLQGAPLDFSLVVDEPRATRVYDSVRMAVSAAPGRIEYLGGGEWADRAPRLFQTALIQTFEDTGRILGVGDRYAIPVSDFVLQTDLRRMELDVSGDDAVVVSIFARMTDGKGGVFGVRKFDARVPVSSQQPA
ncbi:MAG: ABC-type transport auxiliary lipoprotein family protein, partial [Pseudomonadota bacterium]